MATATKATGESVRMRVTLAERRLILARRGAEPPYRLPILSGFREPTTIPELLEVLRTFLDANFGFCIDDHSKSRFIIQGGNMLDELGPTSVFLCEHEHGRDTIDALERDEIEVLAKYRAEREASIDAAIARREAEREARPEHEKARTLFAVLNPEEKAHLEDWRAERYGEGADA